MKKFALILAITFFSCMTSYAMDNQETLDNQLFDAVSSEQDLSGKVMMLLAEGANPNFQKFDPPLDKTIDYDNYMDTPLHIAVRNGHTQSIELLLLENSDPNMQNLGNYTPLHETIYLPEDTAIKVITSLYKYKVNLNAQDEHGNTPLLYAIKYKKFKIADLLIKLGAFKDKQNKEGNTALHETVKDKNLEGLNYLLKKGTATFVKNKYNQTAFDLALEVEDEVPDFALSLYHAE